MINKLNLFAFNIEDEELLLSSFNSLNNINKIQLVEHNYTSKELQLIVSEQLNLNANHELTFQNLFELRLRNNYYIAQCLIDKFFQIPNRDSQRTDRDYEFHIIGMYKPTLQIKNTIVRKEEFIDQITKLFDRQDKLLGTDEHFNRKFIVQSDSIFNLEKVMNQNAIDIFNENPDLVLSTWNDYILISFINSFEISHTRIVEKIFEEFDNA
ncbi:MAG: hypothetical protein IPI46_01725 [Bacteroidetes bacterium]|nr:hypothetical protein [Bacteroidota bacterium]